MTELRTATTEANHLVEAFAQVVLPILYGRVNFQ